MVLENPTDAVLQVFGFVLHPPHGSRTFELHDASMASVDLFAVFPVLVIRVHHISATVAGACRLVVVGAGGQFRNTAVACVRELFLDAVGVGGFVL